MGFRRFGKTPFCGGIAISFLATAWIATLVEAIPVDVPLENEAPAEPVEPLSILDVEVESGSLERLVLRVSESFAGAYVDTTVIVAHGREAGPALCIVAGVHGDEVNGVEVVRRTLRMVSPESLRGSLIAVPIANPSAFRRGSRYLPDRRDLNRYFPGRSLGSSASRIAHGLFDSVIRKCDALVDIHTGSFHRSNIHQLRADLSDPETADLATAFGAKIVVNNTGRTGTLRRAATDEDIPAITVEAGESARFDESHVNESLAGIMRLLESRNMIIKTPAATDSADEASPVSDEILALVADHPGAGTVNGDESNATAYLRTRWVRCNHGGILVSRVGLGDDVVVGQLLGTISDPLSDKEAEVTSPLSGRVIGMAIDQVVMPGFAAYHLGYRSRPLGRIGAATTEVPADAANDPAGLDLEERPE